MSLGDLATLLQETGVEIHRAERVLAENPEDLAVLFNLESLQKRQASLRERFEAAAADSRVDVVYYRLIPKTAEPPVRALNDVLSTFQQAFTVVYDAIKTGVRKTRARVSDASAQASSLGFAYAFPGSVGFALTLPREMQLLDDDERLSAIDAIQSLIAAKTSDDVKHFADTYGIASVRTVYQWIDAIAKNDLDSEVTTAQANREEPLLLQTPDARAVRDVIANTAEVEIEDRSYRGTLLAYDSDRHTFRFAIRDQKNIHGSVAADVADELTVPARYDIRVRASVIKKYSTEEKEEKFELVAIERQH